MRVDDDDDDEGGHVAEDESELLNKKPSPLMTLKPTLSLTKPPSIFSVSSILADKGRYSVLSSVSRHLLEILQYAAVCLPCSFG